MVYNESLTHPSKRAWAVVPDDSGVPGTPLGLLLALTFSSDHRRPFDRLYVGTTGNVAIEGFDGVSTTFLTVPVGHLNVAGRKVNSTNTTASNIVAIHD